MNGLCFVVGLATGALVFLGLQSRFADKLLGIRAVLLQSGTAVVRGWERTYL